MLRRLRPRGRRPLRSRRERGAGPRAWIALCLVPLAGLAWAYTPLAPLAASVPAAHRPPAIGGLPWLHTDAGAILDASGRHVLLRGFNSDALIEPGARHADLDATDAELMRSAGFDVVRLPISWGLLEPVRGSVDQNYLERIAAAVDMLNRNGLYVVFDMHFLDWSAHYGGSGAPGWAAAAAIPDAQDLGPRLLRTHLNPAMNAATTYFWVSSDWQDDFLLVWRAVAERFRDISGVAGYDLYNEPHPLPLPPRIFEQQFMWPLYARAIDAIGAADPNHLFIVEGTFFGNFGTSVRPLTAPDLVYSPHLYTGSLVPPEFTGDPGPIHDKVTDQVHEASLVPAPLWNGELGIDRSMPRSAQWADAALDAFDDAGIGWAWWQWRESRQWGIRDHDGTFLDVAYLRHLARPYLAAAPAGVRGGRGDGTTGRLDIAVDAAHGAAAVEVAWPQLTLQRAPRASGACVASQLWDSGRARLTLMLITGATCTIAVAPG